MSDRRPGLPGDGTRGDHGLPGGGRLAAALALGGVALAHGLWKYVTTLQAAPGESDYANRGGLLDPQGTGVPDANLRLPQLPLKPLITGSSSGSSGR